MNQNSLCYQVSTTENKLISGEVQPRISVQQLEVWQAALNDDGFDGELLLGEAVEDAKLVLLGKRVKKKPTYNRYGHLETKTATTTVNSHDHFPLKVYGRSISLAVYEGPIDRGVVQVQRLHTPPNGVSLTFSGGVNKHQLPEKVIKDVWVYVRNYESEKISNYIQF